MVSVYLDHAATTPIDPAVVAAMQPYLGDDFGNPSARYGLGVRALEALDGARRTIAQAVGAEAANVIFGSGGTEANNLAVFGAARRNRGGRVLIGATEHPSVREAAFALRREGFEVLEVPLAPDGSLDLDAYAQRLTPDTVLVAQMLVNNEVGTIYPVGRLARLIRRDAPQAHFHVDAVQALGKLQVSLSELGCDSLALSAHKLHAPKGSGCLVTRAGVQLEPLFHGGGQECGRRSGTENVAGAVALGAAVEIAEREASRFAAHADACRSALLAGLAGVPGAGPLFGEAAPPRSAAIVSVELPGPPAEVWLHHLESEGVMVSAGSACQAKKDQVSHVLLAHGLDTKRARQMLRFSFGRTTTLADVQLAVAAIERTFSTLSALNS